jgi:NAD(P)-dependent dehydrogenase (short-subunit alcohol dehydrogenase family)
MKLEGRVAVITGGGYGIGAAIGRLFAQEGARVALIGRDGAKGEKTRQAIRSRGGDCRFYVADVSKADQVAKVAAQILKDYPKVDILVNNAGIWRPGRVVDLDEETWDSVLDTNLKGMFLVSRHFLPGMMERKSGVVINVSSVAGLVGAAEASAYAASKGGIVNLSRHDRHGPGRHRGRPLQARQGRQGGEAQLAASAPDRHGGGRSQGRALPRFR